MAILITKYGDVIESKDAEPPRSFKAFKNLKGETLRTKSKYDTTDGEDMSPEVKVEVVK
jgi:hypothetical protein